MSFGSKAQKMPDPPPPLPPPVIEDTQARGRQDAEALRRRQGRASTILSGGTGGGTASTDAVGTKQLLGS